ncbi:BQ5605_C013g07081 [Microbotryum silenes-dioicae]|uniref:Kynureninase n=1 Tax=Microbotryum silenes-dioicae TaxID=796604 RepID=A0A2X0LV20_9BASI|nr:BQ5605_C013g07081 [Microbotryum silenes-dioicae]
MMDSLQPHADDDVQHRLAAALAASGESSLTSPKFAAYLDQQETVSRSDQFSFPSVATVRPPGVAKATVSSSARDSEPSVYLAGNSLGLMPNSTPKLIQEELEAWKSQGVLGHVEHPYERPWVKIDEIVTPILAEIVGAKPAEVACMGSLTSNIHILFTTFYRPTSDRHKILYEGKAFPSDQYAFASQVEMRGLAPSSLLPMDPRPREYTLRTEDILHMIEEQGDSIAIICFGAVQYYSGQWFDMETITRAGHAKGCLVAFDCAHAVGNVPIRLHDWGVDFAAWCSYKYLNSGPGGIAGLYVHERWADKKRLAGWWGHDTSTRFAMPNVFAPSPGAAGWQLSNPSVLDVISLYSSLQVFQSVGSSASAGSASFMAALRHRSLLLTGYLEALLKQSPYYVGMERVHSTERQQVKFTLITPSDPEQRGAQLSLLFGPPEAMDVIFDGLRSAGVLGDERRPGVIRLAPVPLYNSFRDVHQAATSLDGVIAHHVASL